MPRQAHHTAAHIAQAKRVLEATYPNLVFAVVYGSVWRARDRATLRQAPLPISDDDCWQVVDSIAQQSQQQNQPLPNQGSGFNTAHQAYRSVSPYIPQTAQPIIGAGLGAAQTAQSVGTNFSPYIPALGALATPVGMVVAAVVAATLAAVVMGIRKSVSNVRQMGELGEHTAGRIAQGIKSASMSLFHAGVSLVDTVLGGIASQFGATGSAVQRLVGSITQAAGRVLNSLFDTFTSLSKTAGRVVGTGIGIAGGFAGYLLGAGMLGGPISGIIGMVVATSLGVLVSKVMAVVADIVGGLLSKLGAAFGELGQIGATAIRSFIDIVQDGMRSAQTFARAAYDLSAHSGLSLTASGNAILTRGAFGMTPDQVSGAYSPFGRMPIFQNALNSAWGVGGELGSEANMRSVLESARRKDVLMRRIMLQMQPEGEDYWLRLASMPQAKIDRQLEFSRGLGMNPEAIKGWQEDVFLLQSSWTQAVEFIKMTIGTAFLPMIKAGLEGATRYVKQHRDEIISFIFDIAEWFYVKAPDYVLRGVELILKGIAWMVDGVANLLRSFRHHFGDFLKFLDGVINTLRSFAINMAGVIAAAAAPGGFAGKAIAAVLARNYVANRWQESNLYDRFYTVDNINRLGRAERAVRGVGTGIHNFGDNLRAQAEAMFGTREERQQQMDQWRRMAAGIEKIADANEKGVPVTIEIKDKTDNLLVEVLTRVSQEAYMVAGR